MGYYTRYSLKIPRNDSLIDAVRNKYVDAGMAISPGGGTRDAVKWYNHEKDISEFSKEYPILIFQLDGIGEEDGDIWRKYFKNGKIQRVNAILVYDEYDANKLEELKNVST